MKTKKELFEEILEENQKTLYVREVDLDYHTEILIPKYKKIKNKKVKKAKIEKAEGDIVAINNLISDLKGITKIIKRKIKEIK